MSFVKRDEVRANPPLSPRYGYPSSTAMMGGSYAEISLHDAESSLQSVAVGSSTDLIASLASELEFGVYSGKGQEKRERPTPGYLEDPAGDGHGVEDWSYRVLMSWLMRGNLFCDILDQRAGHPTQLLPYHPDDVSGYLDRDGAEQWIVNGRPVTDKSRFLHRRVNPMPGRVLGLSPVQRHARTIGLNITATQFGLQWFTDGAHPSGMLVNSEVELTKTVVDTAKQRFLAAVRGSREPIVLGKGWDYKQIQLKPEESQFLESQGFSAAECCRIFGPGLAEILGYEVGGSLTYSTVEGRNAHLLVYTVNKWLRRLERLMTSMLPRPQYVRIDRDKILQSTTLERYRAHALARWKKINEIREEEDLPPVEWGDKPMSGSQSADLDDDSTPTQGGKQ